LFPELAVPRMPFIGAYAIRVRSLSAVEALLSQEKLDFRRAEQALAVPFPAELGLGAWVFVERDADLPWRSGR
jgi:hypothetical protein